MTVRETLALPAFRHTAVHVLVGADKLDTPVRWVHVAESTRAGQLLRGGELLLATGSGWGTDPAARRALVRAFHDAGAAALLLEIGEFWTDVPPEVTQTCRATGLPLVTTGSEIRFRDVSEQVHSTLLDREVATVEAMREVAETFTTMIVDGAPPQQLIRQAARLLGAPVILEDPAHRVVHYAVGLEQPSTLLDNWTSRSSRWAGAVGRTGTVAEPVPLPAPDAGWCVDVMARGTHWGRLITLGTPTPDAGASHVLRQAAVALAVERLGAARPFTWEDLLNRSALDRLTGTLYTTTDGLAEVLAASGFRTRNRSLIALEVRGPGTSGPVEAATVRRIADRTGWDVLAAPGSVTPGSATGPTSGAASDRISAVVSAPAGGDPLGTLRTLADWPGTAVLVSPPQRDVGALSRTLRSLGRIRDAAPGVTVVGGTPVSTVIDELRDDVHVRDFAARLLEPLLDYDHRHDGDLVETTAAVLRHPSSRSAVAEDLHLSRTSLYSRIATIERLLGMDLGDGETQFALGLALRTR
jgi:purine catabolism regulator